MSKHLNPKTGEVSSCRAKNPDSCPFTRESEKMGLGNVHFDNEADAYKKFEEIMKNKEGLFKKISNNNDKLVLDPDDVEKKYSGNTGDWIHVDGAQVKIQDTGEIYTIKIIKMGRRGIAKAYDEAGREITRYVPGHEYSVVSGPNTDEFKDRLEELRLRKESLTKARLSDEASENLMKKLSAKSESLGAGLSLSFRMFGEPRQEEAVIRGSNKNGEHYFEFKVNRTGEIVNKVTADSRLYRNVEQAAKTIRKEEIKNFYNKHDDYQRTGYLFNNKWRDNDNKYFLT